MNIKYFDHAATTAVAPEVLHEMIPYFSKNYGMHLLCTKLQEFLKEL